MTRGYEFTFLRVWEQEESYPYKKGYRYRWSIRSRSNGERVFASEQSFVDLRSCRQNFALLFKLGRECEIRQTSSTHGTIRRKK